MGSQMIDGSFKTLTAGEALVAFRLLTINSSGQFVYCGAGGVPLAVAQNDYASGAHAVGKLLNNGAGTFKVMVAAAVSAIGTRLYAAASGKLSPTGTGRCVAIALEAATGDGSIIEVMPILNANTDMFVTRYTANGTDQSNGYVDIDTGFGAAPAALMGAPLAAQSGGTLRVVASVTFLSGGNAGKVRVTVTSLASGDTVDLGAVRVAG